ncbi:MAG: DUF1592 domain-containing protein [Alphaproteobacteria bacterium]|nr:DUF1592 domain-containing protein [Alphaproteobacteria bacterium]
MRPTLLLASLLLVVGCDRRKGDPDAEDAVCVDEGEPPPRQLRLLTRREYNRTVSDLFRLDDVRTCTWDSDCLVESESCVGGTCEPDPCNLITFRFAANGNTYDSVHVAGTFNGWSPTVDGGWPMTYLADRDLWVTKQVVDDGEHQYKFVINESDWAPDPNNPRTTPDGYGGDNSVLTVDCADAADAVFNAAADFPVESRPQGFYYDNNVDAGLVTSVHVEQYLRAGQTLVEQALREPQALTGCALTEDGCVEGFLSDFGGRAFRRPMRDEELSRYMARVEAEDDVEAGLSVALQVMLSSPYFLYRFEIGEPTEGGHHRLSGYETAAALSYLFWGTMPDDALLEAAASGALDSAEGVEVEARRLLADPRARDVIGTFGVQWLGVEGVPAMDRSAALYPDYTDALGADMLEETRRFVETVVFDGGGRWTELMTAETTWVNPRLAALYGLPAPEDGWALVATADGRAGVLGQASVLAATAHSDQTSPVRRGLFVRQRLLCQDLGTPPPDAGGVPDVDPNATTRERFDQHTSIESCHYCHQYIDEVGFGFESFDAVGAFRAHDNGLPVDSRGNMNDVEGIGTDTHAAFDSPAGLGGILATSEAAPTCFTTQVYRFVYGREDAAGEACAITDAHDQFAQADYDIQELLVAVVTDPGFRLRREAP